MGTAMIFRELFCGYLFCVYAWIRLRRRPSAISAVLRWTYVIYTLIPFVILLSSAITSLVRGTNVDWALVVVFGAMTAFSCVYGACHPSMHVYNIDLDLVRDTMQQVRPCTWELMPAEASPDDALYAKASPRWYRVEFTGTGDRLRTSVVRNNGSIMLAPDGDWTSEAWKTFVRDYASALQQRPGKPNYKVGVFFLIMGCLGLGTAIVGMIWFIYPGK